MQSIAKNTDLDMLLGLLCKMPTLASFGRANLNRLVKHATLRRFAAGETIIREGDQDNLVYFLVAGVVAVYKGGVRINLIRRCGDIFGEMGMIDGNVRSATIVAQADTTCVCVDSADLEGVPGDVQNISQGVLYRAFAEVLANRLRKMNQEIEYLRKELNTARSQNNRGRQ